MVALPPMKRMVEQHELFVEAFCETGDAHVAAERAGYDLEKLGIKPETLLRSPSMAISIRREMERRLTVAAPNALNVMLSFLSPEVSDKLRFSASRDILERSGAKIETKNNGNPQLSIAEMDIPTLKQLASQLQSEIKHRPEKAKLVESSSVDAAPIEQQLIDLIG